MSFEAWTLTSTVVAILGMSVVDGAVVLIGRRRTRTRKKFAFRGAPWAVPTDGVVIYPELFEQGVYPGQRSARDLLSEWGTAHDVKIMFVGSANSGR